MTDPYVVLGVSRTASDEEIKKKYRELARKYHPDNYANNPLADLAQEKMKQINEAYDAITKERAGGGAQYKTYTQPGSTSSGSASGPYRDVRSAIMAGDLARAEMILGSIVDRNAEWHFLMGAVAYNRGWMDEASKYFRQAASMDPGNAEYRQAVAQMESQANGPFAGGSAVGMNTLDCGAFCPCMALMATSGGCAPFICCC